MAEKINAGVGFSNICAITLSLVQRNIKHFKSTFIVRIWYLQNSVLAAC